MAIFESVISQNVVCFPNFEHSSTNIKAGETGIQIRWMIIKVRAKFMTICHINFAFYFIAIVARLVITRTIESFILVMVEIN